MSRIEPAERARVGLAFRWPSSRWVGIASLVATVALPLTLVAQEAIGSSPRVLHETYVGTGVGTVSGTSIAGHALLHGSGKLLGPSTLRGQATGSLTSATTATFSGSGTMTGPGGKTIVLITDDAKVSGSMTTTIVDFSGSATVQRTSTAAVAGSLRLLAYKGSYNRATGKVSITLSGTPR